jgi:HdeA/HdeB family
MARPHRPEQVPFPLSRQTLCAEMTRLGEKPGGGFVRVFSLALVSLIVIITAVPAPAQIVDVAKISCKQYLTGTIVRQDYLTLWLSGYLSGTRNDTVIQTGTVQNVADKVGTYCRSNLDAGLMDAVQNVLGAGK